MSPSKFCSNCGSALAPGSQFCRECGATIQESAATNPAAVQSNHSEPESDKGIHSLLAILIVFIPLVGLITFFAYSTNRPKASKQSCYAALIGVVVDLVFIIIGAYLFNLL